MQKILTFLAPFRCDVDGINNERQIVRRQRNYVVALKGLIMLAVSNFGFEGVNVVLIVPVPGNCLLFTYDVNKRNGQTIIIIN